MRGAHIRLWVLRGPQQNKFDADLAEAWQPLGGQVQFVQSAKSGKNALDFHIAFCLGEAHQEDIQNRRAACYVVVSRDKGFEALFGYMRSLGSVIDRADNVPEALKLAESMARPSVTPSKAPVKEPKPAPKKPKPVPKPAPLSKDAEIVFSHLRDHPRTRPTTRKKLEHHVTSLLGNKIDAAVTNAVISELTRVGALAFEGTKPRYVFPKARKQDGAR